MNIIWHGHSCFTIKGKDVTLVTDPYNEEIGLKLPKLKANIVTVSHDHKGHNNAKAVEECPKIIDWPGEYDINGVYLKGMPAFHFSQSEKEFESRGNIIIFSMEIDGFKICHLGDLGHKLTNEMTAEIGEVDILMVPVGGNDTINAKKAHEVIEQIDPFVVIPMHYKIPGLKYELETLEPFTKEFGKGTDPMEEFKVKLPADLKKSENTEFVILQPQMG